MKTIQILMSTYNGEKYLKEQIESILTQDCQKFGIASFTLKVRDDGSGDGTAQILQEYADKYPEIISWYQGENVGVIKSFFDLMSQADACDYYAFADQDDYWMPEKLTRAIEKLQELPEEKPLLYCCRPKLVDADLHTIESAIDRSSVRPAFENAMIENIATGCTEVFNRSMHEMVVREFPKFTVMHDWWLYLVATCFGEMIYDEDSYICYRQHGGNVLGTKTSHLEEFKMRIARYKKNRGNISRQLGELVRIFGQQYPENEKMLLAKEMLQVKKSFPARVRFLKKAGIYRQRKMDDRIFRWILRMGSY